MRTKQHLTLLQFRITATDKQRLSREAERLGMNEATLARLSLREGLHRIGGKLSTHREREAVGE